MTDDKTVDALITALDDLTTADPPLNFVRIGLTIDALADTNDPRAAAALLRAFDGLYEFWGGGVAAGLRAEFALESRLRMIDAGDPLVALLALYDAYHDDRNVRVRLLRAVAELGDQRAVPHLLALLPTVTRWGRDVVYEALAGCGWDAELAPLLDLLRADDPQLRQKVAEALPVFGDGALPHLVALLDDPHFTVRRQAADELGRLGDRRAIGPLHDLMVRAARDEWRHGGFPVTEVRAAFALAHLGDARGIDAVIHALTLPDGDTRAEAAALLVHLGDRRAIEPLWAAVEAEYDDEIQQELEIALEMFGEVRDEPSLDELLAELHSLTGSSRMFEADKIRETVDAVVAHGDRDAQIGLLRAFDRVVGAWTNETPITADPILEAVIDMPRDDTLVALLALYDAHEHDELVRELIAEAIGRLGDRRAVEPLFGRVASSEEVIRTVLILAIGSLGGDRAFDALLTLARSPDEMNRRYAAIALGKFGERGVAPLLALLEDADPSVQRRAARELAKLGDLRAVEPLYALVQAAAAASTYDAFARKTSAVAAVALARLGDGRAFNTVIWALRHGAAPRRADAAEALALLGDTRAVPHLRAALDDATGYVARQVAEALEALGE